MRAVRVVWRDTDTGEVHKDETVPYEGSIESIADTVELTVAGPGFITARFEVELSFDPPIPAFP